MYTASGRAKSNHPHSVLSVAFLLSQAIVLQQHFEGVGTQAVNRLHYYVSREMLAVTSYSMLRMPAR